MVARFADHPAVLGYDIMNEPTFNSLGTAEEAAAIADDRQASGDWRNETLEAFTQRVIDGIREVDADGWIVAASPPRWSTPWSIPVTSAT